MFGCGIEKMCRPLGEILRIGPTGTHQRPIEMMLDHPLKGPGLRALQRIQAAIEIEAVFSLNVGADEGRVRDLLAFVIDVRQLSIWRSGRERLLLAVGETGHLELDLGLGHERADFRQAETSAEAVENDHRKLLALL